MNITLVVDHLNWGVHFSASKVAELCSGEHDFKVTDINGLNEDYVKDADIVMAWIDPAERKIFELWKKYKFTFVSRIPGWKGVFRTYERPERIRRAINGIVCCNLEIGMATQKIYPNKLVMTITNGVDVNAFVPAHRLGNGWGWVGRLHDIQKGVPMMEEIRKDWGDRIKVRTQRRDKDNKIVPTDFPREMVEYYQGLRGFFRTSMHEGSSNCLLESMSCGLPVVATPTGIAFRVLEPRWLCVAPNHMLRRMRELNDDNELAVQVGKRNREEILTDWRWTQRREPYNEFFERCIE